MGWRRYFRRARWDRDRREEIESYIQIETEDNIARGIPKDEARFAARRKFGNATRVREEVYRMNTVALFDAFVRNLRHALRDLRHNPAFTAAALLTLALGIGANTAVFSVIDSVLLRPLPYPHPEQLVALRQLAPGAVGLTGVSDGLLLSSSMYFTYAGGNRAFRSLGVFQGGGAVVAGLAEPEQVRAVFVSDGVLETLGVQPRSAAGSVRQIKSPEHSKPLCSVMATCSGVLAAVAPLSGAASALTRNRMPSSA